MNELEVSEITDADAAAVAGLWEDCGLTRAWNDPAADIAFARSVPCATILVGRLEGRIVASAMVGHDGHRGTVYYVSVHPETRGNGIGGEIMTAAEDWLAQQGVWKVNLVVRSDNAQAVEFYRAIGYESEERINLSKWIDPAKRPA